MVGGNNKATATLILVAIVVVTAIAVAYMTGMPRYNVWHAKMAGEAELAQANQNRQIKVLDANAEAEATEIHARAVAASNKIIGDSLKDNPDYLRWMWLNKLDQNTGKTVVYVPTDGMVPELETGRVGVRGGN